MKPGAGGMRLQDAARGAKRGLILAEAIRLFNRVGYFDTRLEDVAARLGTAKTSISYHFKSKEALLAEAYNANCEFVEGLIAQTSDENDGLSRVTRWMRLLAEANVAIARGNAQPVATINDLIGLSDEARPQVTDRLQAIGREVTGYVRQGVEDGSIAVRSIEGTALFLLNSPQWMQPWLHQVDPMAYPEAIEAMIDLFLYGLLKNRETELHTPTPAFSGGSTDFLFDREARNKMKIEAFLRAGTRNFNRHGYTNLALGDVTEELGVSRGSFYYYMDDKDALLSGCVNRTLEQIEQAFAVHAGRAPAAQALFNVAATIYQGHITDLDPLLRRQLFESLCGSEYHIANARLARIRANFDELVAKGMSDDSARDCSVDGIGEIILGAIYGATRQRIETFGIGQAGVGAQWATPGTFFEPLFTGIAAGR